MITFEYKGEKIGEFSTESEKVLQTAMKYCEDDIVVKSDLYPLNSDLEQFYQRAINPDVSGQCGDVAYSHINIITGYDGSTGLSVWFVNSPKSAGYTYKIKLPYESEFTEVEEMDKNTYNKMGMEHHSRDRAVIRTGPINLGYYSKDIIFAISNGTDTLTITTSVMDSIAAYSILRDQADKKLVDYIVSRYWYDLMAARYANI